MLTAAVVRVVTIPDSSPCGAAMRRIAETESTFSDQRAAFVWAHVVLATLSMPEEAMPAGCAQIPRDHAANCTRPEQVRDSILECSIARTYAGDSSNMRLVVDGQLQNISLCLTRSLVASGTTLRLGAPLVALASALLRALFHSMS